jgi:hypothetical protein
MGFDILDSELPPVVSRTIKASKKKLSNAKLVAGLRGLAPVTNEERAKRQEVGMAVLSALANANLCRYFDEDSLPTEIEQVVIEEQAAIVLDSLVDSGVIVNWTNWHVFMEKGEESGRREPFVKLSVSDSYLDNDLGAKTVAAPYGLQMGALQLHPGMGDVLRVMQS